MSRSTGMPKGVVIGPPRQGGKPTQAYLRRGRRYIPLGAPDAKDFAARLDKALLGPEPAQGSVAHLIWRYQQSPEFRRLEHWREAWADHVNARLAELGIDAHVDHRSLEAQGIDLEPQHKIGAAAQRLGRQGLVSERIEDHRQIARRNGERIIADPRVALSAITHQQATFTEHDLARFVHRHSDGKDQFDQVKSAIRTSPELVALGRDGQGRQRFTSREMLDVERRLEQSAQAMAERRDHGVSIGRQDVALAKSAAAGLSLSEEQRDAFDHVAGRERLSLVVGYAGSGKSAMLGVAREAWEAQGYRVQGAALSGIAAENLEGGSAIPSRTLASLEYGWARGRDQLSANDVLVIDEAGLVGSRQMQRVLDHAEKAGAKVVMVGDAEQLQAIEAGAAFRALTERHGAAEISQIRRQREDWQRQATRHLATGRTDQALAAYEAAGTILLPEDYPGVHGLIARAVRDLKILNVAP